METNFFGPMKLTRLLIPHMRRQGSGTIINISSTAGIEAKASRSLYSASKSALEAFSEALYLELQPFNIRVLLVEPGAFGTSFAGACVMPEKEMPEEYKGTITDLMLEGLRNLAEGRSPGDVEKGVRAIFDVVMKTGQAEGMEEFLRLPLGRDGSARWVVKLDNLRRNLDETEKIWSSTDKDP
jgi:short-subunit dehydrogenase